MAQGRSTKVVSMMKWIRTRRLSIKKSLPLARRAGQEGGAVRGGGWGAGAGAQGRAEGVGGGGGGGGRSVGAQGGAEGGGGGDEGLLMVTAQEMAGGQGQSGLIRGVISFQRFWAVEIIARMIQYYCHDDYV